MCCAIPINAARVRVNPERLKEARLSKGLSPADLAELIGISRQAVGQFEAGVTVPKVETVHKMMSILGLSISFFLQPSPQYQIGEIHFRKRFSTKVKSQGKVRARLSWIGDIVCYLQQFLDFPTPDYETYVQKKGFLPEDIETIAMALRKKWGLGMAPIANMMNLLENHGFFIAKMHINEDELDACSAEALFYGEMHPLVCLSYDKTAVRSRFDLAHELGHMIMHAHISPGDAKDEELHRRMESEANYFASAFLMPRDSFLKDIYSLTSLDSYGMIKPKWKTSIAAMLYRVKDLDCISGHQYTNLQRQRTAKGWRKFEPLDDVIEHEMPAMLRNSVYTLLENDIQTKEEILDNIPLPLDELESLCGFDGRQSPFSQSPKSAEPILRLLN